MITGLFPLYCASPLLPSRGCIPREARSHNPVVGLHPPRGWLQGTRPLTAETGVASAAATSPRKAFPSGTENRVGSRRRWRQRYLETRLCGANSASSASPDSGAFSGEGGAEWAGWECRFSATDGKPVPVPEDYVPESLREWDVEVWGFETLTSEQLRPGEEGKDGAGKDKDKCKAGLYRKRGRVYPETGCALDNLTLEVNAQTSPLEGDGTFVASFRTGGHVVGKEDDREGSTSLQLEVGIVVPGVQFTDPSMTTTEGDAAEVEEDISRLRVDFRVDSASESSGSGGDKEDPAAAVLGPTVTVTRERQYRDTFDDGLLYKGGGLDSQNLRRLLRSKCFAESEAAPTSNDLAGRWAACDGRWQLLDSPTATTDRPLDAWTEATAQGVGHALGMEGARTLLLSGGITVRSGPWHPGDGGSGTPAAAASAGTGGTASNGEAGWAVEVGWFLGDDKADDKRRSERVVLTTVLDARTMTPLAVWRGEERRE